MNIDLSLHEAAKYGDLEAVIHHIKKLNKFVDSLDDNNTTSLIYAANKGHEKIVEFLIKEGASINVIFSNYSPLMLASMNGHKNIVKLLLDCGCDLTTKDARGNNALMLASKKGFFDIVKMIDSNGIINLNECNAEGLNALMLASINGHLNITNYLIEKGTNLYLKDSHDSSALALAVIHNQYDIFKILFNSIDIKLDKDEFGVLHHAITSRNYNILEFLLSNGAVIKQTHVAIAAEDQDLKSVELLLSHGGIFSEKAYEILNSLSKLAIKPLYNISKITDKLFNNEKISDEDNEFLLNSMNSNLLELSAKRIKTLQSKKGYDSTKNLAKEFKDNITDIDYLNHIKSKYNSDGVFKLINDLKDKSATFSYYFHSIQVLEEISQIESLLFTAKFNFKVGGIQRKIFSYEDLDKVIDFVHNINKKPTIQNLSEKQALDEMVKLYNDYPDYKIKGYCLQNTIDNIAEFEVLFSKLSLDNKISLSKHLENLYELEPNILNDKFLEKAVALCDDIDEDAFDLTISEDRACKAYSNSESDLAISADKLTEPTSSLLINAEEQEVNLTGNIAQSNG